MTMTYGRIRTERSYCEVREIAYRTLEKFEITDFPIYPLQLANKVDNLRIFTYKDWMRKFGMTYNEVIEFANSKDGCTTYDPVTDRFIILYSDNINKSGRIRFTIMHEFAHVILGHYKKDPNAILARKSLTSIEDPGKEREADMFSAEMLAPSFLVRYLPDEDIKYLQRLFDVTDAMARVSFMRVNRLCRKYGPQSVMIPEYLAPVFGVYISAIKQKHLVETLQNRKNPDPDFVFNVKTGFYEPNHMAQ